MPSRAQYFLQNAIKDATFSLLLPELMIRSLYPKHFLLCALLLIAPGLSADEGVFLITDHGARGDNAFDNAPVINQLIGKFGPEGGTILVPVGDFRINSPIVIDRNNVTIRGVNYGQRSNVDPAPPGIFGPPGGSKIILGGGVERGISVVAASGTIEGLTVRDLAIQGSDGGVAQTGISIDRANKWTRLDNVSCINLRRGIFMVDSEQADITSCWLAECESPLYMVRGRDCSVTDSAFGGQPGGVSCDFNGQVGLNFTGNVIFPDGFTALWLTDSRACNVSHNTITGWYTGLIQVEGNANFLSHNLISAVETNGGWPGDPRGRGGDYGLIRITGNDNVFIASTIHSWQPDGDVRVRILGGDRNVLRNLTIGARPSSRRIWLDGASTQATLITHAGYPGEIDLGASSGTRVTYDP